MNKKVKDTLHSMQSVSKVAMSKFMQYELFDRIFIAYLWILTFFTLFMPIFSIQHITNDSETNFYLFANWYFFKSFLIVFISLVVIIWWNVSTTIKNNISLVFWFDKSGYLLNFWLLWTITTAYIAISETITTIKTVTPIVSISMSNIIVQILLFIWLAYTLYLTINVKKHWRHIHIINESTKSHNETPKNSMFAEMKSSRFDSEE